MVKCNMMENVNKIMRDKKLHANSLSICDPQNVLCTVEISLKEEYDLKQM